MDRRRLIAGRRGGASPTLLLVSALAGVLAACGENATEPQIAAEPGPPVETRSRVDRAVATTGDVITYTVIVDYDPAYEVEIPEPGAEIAGFRILDVGSEEPREERGRTVEERWYKLRADLVGSYVLPTVAVAYRQTSAPRPEEGAAAGDAAVDAETRTIETSEIFIEVQSVLPADGEVTDIRELKPLRRIEPLPTWPLQAIRAVLLVIALIIWWIWGRDDEPIRLPPRPAHEIAFEALDRLRGTDFEDHEAMRRFHFEISEVVRAYVENRFTLNATDLTTEEILAHLGELADLDRDSGERLQGFLAATDRVKFAAYEPAEGEIGDTYEGALSFVEATRERSSEEAATVEETALEKAA